LDEINSEAMNSALVKDHLFQLPRGLDLKTLAGVFVLAGLTTLLYRAFLHPFARIPGPRLAAVTGLWRSYYYARGEWHDDILRLHSTYGRVVRIAPNEVSVVDASAMKRLFGHGKGAKKTTWYNTFKPGGIPSIFVEQEPKLHSALRKRVSVAYSMSAVLRYEKYIQGCIDLCLSKLKYYAEEGKIVEMSDWINAMAFDVVGELGYGQQLGHLRTESDVNGVRAMLLTGFKSCAILGHFPGQIRLMVNPLSATLMSIFGIEDPFEKFDILIEQRIAARREGRDGADRPDMLSHFLSMKSLDGRTSATDTEVLGEAKTLM
jgi:cytochrome P450